MRPDLEDELLLDLDLMQPTSVLHVSDPDRLEASIALWQRGVVAVEFFASGGGGLVGRVRLLGGDQRGVRHEAWLEYVAQFAIDWLDALDAADEDREDDEGGEVVL